MEERNKVQTLTTTVEPPLLQQFSSWHKLLRITAYLLRFPANIRRRRGEPLTIGLVNWTEMKGAETTLIQLHQ